MTQSSVSILVASAAATTAAASVIPSTNVERRFFSGSQDVCFGQCNPIGGTRVGLFGAVCECYPGFSGECCKEELPCAELEIETADLDLAEFTRASWFTQWQQTTPFEPTESLYCVNAAFDYNPAAPGDATYTAANSGNLNGINGDINGAVACIAESDVSGKLLFAPCPVFNIPSATGNPFWVLDIGKDAHTGEYEWAIVTGGPPTERLDDGRCGTRDGVFALITRQPVASKETLMAMYKSLVKRGLSTNLLVKVQQEGCTYDGIRIKSGGNGDGPGPVAPTSFGPAPPETPSPPLVICPNGRPEGTPGANCGSGDDEPTSGGSCSVAPITTFPLDLNEFTRASWYTQLQQEDDFQKKENFFCTSATYDFTTEGPNGVSITASNFGRDEGVDGPVSGIVLCAGATDTAGKLKVAPCPVFTVGAGDFWVLDAGVDANGEYEWAVVVAGQPETLVAEDGKCTAARGLFMNTRNKEATPAQLDAMYAAIDKAGISTGLLFPVTQAGCSYEWRTKDGVSNAGPGPKPPTSFAPAPGSNFVLCPNGRPRGTPGADCAEDSGVAGQPAGPPAFVLCPNGRPRGTPGADCAEDSGVAGPPAGPPAFVFCPNGRPRGTPGADC